METKLYPYERKIFSEYLILKENEKELKQLMKYIYEYLAGDSNKNVLEII